MLVLSGGLFSPREACAQAADGAGETPLGERLTGLAKAEYAAARVLYQDGDYGGARRKFEEALRLSSEPRLLWNIAACEKGERKYARARRTLERYREAASASLTPDERLRVDELVQNLAPFVSTLKIAVEPRDARISIDGEAIAVADPSTPVFVDFGKRRIDVEKPGFTTRTQTVDLRGGETLTVAIGLEREVRVGTLRVQTDDDATVLVDGQSRGIGPLTIEVAPGVHSVRVTAPDRRDFVADVAIENRATRTIDAALEEEEDGGLPAWFWIAGGSLLVAGAVTTVVVVASDAGGVTPVKGTFGSVDIGEF